MFCFLSFHFQTPVPTHCDCHQVRAHETWSTPTQPYLYTQTDHSTLVPEMLGLHSCHQLSFSHSPPSHFFPSDFLSFSPPFLLSTSIHTPPPPSVMNSLSCLFFYCIIIHLVLYLSNDLAPSLDLIAPPYF